MCLVFKQVINENDNTEVNQMFQRIFKFSVLYLLLLFVSTQTWAKENNITKWPMEIKTEQGVVLVYQPQPETLTDNNLKGRAAVVLKLKELNGPIFGAIMFNAHLETNRRKSTTTITNVRVNNIHFRDSDESVPKQLTDLIKQEFIKWKIVVATDKMLAVKKIKSNPPQIIFVTKPAVLVTIDGEPQWQDEKNTNLKRVANTAFTILYEQSTKIYYLYAGNKAWYTTSSLMGDWFVADLVTQEVAKHASKKDPMEQRIGKQTKKHKTKSAAPPKVIVVTKPSELFYSNGKPEFKPFEGSDLHYMSNSDSDVLMDTKQQKYYVLLSGHWYSSKKMEGPWEYIPVE